MSSKLIVDNEWDNNQKEQYLATHFGYELTMLQACTNSVCYYHKAQEPNDTIMALEDCILHGRNLQEFFFKPKDKARCDTVLASCFVQEENKWESERGPIDKWPRMQEICKRASIELAHLTTDRTDESRDWDCPALMKEAAKLTLIFLENLPPTYDNNRMLQDIKSRCHRIEKKNWEGGVVSTSLRWVHRQAWNGKS